jgi:predicted transcriptional regulator
MWMVGKQWEIAMAQEKIVTLRMDGASPGKLDKLHAWQIAEIQKGLGEAERGEFASEAEVKRLAKKWARRAR